MLVSRIQSRGRITVPPEVCEALGLKRGDVLSYDIDGDKVILTRDPSSDAEYESDDMTDEDLAPIIDRALADRGETFVAGDVFDEIRARLAGRRGRMDAA